MFLGRSIEDEEGVSHTMADVLPFTTHMLPRTLTLGYREVEVVAPFLPPLVARGHEFHRATLVPSADAPALARAFVVRDPRHGAAVPAGFCAGRTLASWVHLHFASAPAMASALVGAARDGTRA